MAERPNPLNVVSSHEHGAGPCVACGVPLHRSDSMCGACGRPMPEGQGHFGLLGLEERYALGDETLAESFRRASWAMHPDRFATASPTERRVAVQRTTMLNDAYRTLRDPVKRAVYLLQRSGARPGEPQGTRDPELLMEVMEGRERVEELKAALRASAPGALAELSAIRAEVDGRLAALHGGLQAEFERYDGITERPAALRAIGSLVERIRYFSTTKAELDQLALTNRLTV